MHKICIPVIIALLTGCSTVAEIKAVAPIVRASIERVNDAKMDRSRQFICNNVYRAERAAIERWNVGGVFRPFCSRAGGPSR